MSRAFRTTLAVVTVLAGGSAGLSSRADADDGHPAASLAGPYWKAIALSGQRIAGGPSRREPHLVFRRNGRVSGSDGCNRLTGAFDVAGDAISFGVIASTRMACPDTGAIENGFREALRATARWRRIADRLELIDASGATVALFAARIDGASDDPPGLRGHELAGTSWRLVKFQGADGTTVTPAASVPYTVVFGDDGRLTARLPCEQGGGTWSSEVPPGIRFGPLVLTASACQRDPVRDHVVRQWPMVRSYVLKDGHLFLSLFADGGVFEYAPLSAAP